MGGHHHWLHRSGRNWGHNLWPPKTHCDPVTMPHGDRVTERKFCCDRVTDFYVCAHCAHSHEFSLMLFFDHLRQMIVEYSLQGYFSSSRRWSLRPGRYEQDFTCLNNCIFLCFSIWSRTVSVSSTVHAAPPYLGHCCKCVSGHPSNTFSDLLRQLYCNLCMHRTISPWLYSLPFPWPVTTSKNLHSLVITLEKLLWPCDLIVTPVRAASIESMVVTTPCITWESELFPVTCVLPALFQAHVNPYVEGLVLYLHVGVRGVPSLRHHSLTSTLRTCTQHSCT